MLGSLIRHAAPTTIQDNPLWLVVLCDLMTNLMIFFLMMYALSVQSQQKQQEWIRTFETGGVIEDPARRRAEAALREFREREAAAAFQESFRKAGLAQTSEVTVTERSIRVSLRNKLLFETAQARLAPAARRTLEVLAQVLKQIPNDVVVEGHTDIVPVVAGPYRTNWELSVARSYSVIQGLTEGGLPPERLIASGYGEHHPLAPNDTREGRERNRRVEIVILRGSERDE